MNGVTLVLGCFLAYLLVGVILVRVATLIEPLSNEESEDDGFIIGVIVLWPLFIVGVVGVFIYESVKKFIAWDPRAWNARRKTRNIEEDLSKESDGGP